MSESRCTFTGCTQCIRKALESKPAKITGAAVEGLSTGATVLYTSSYLTCCLEPVSSFFAGICCLFTSSTTYERRVLAVEEQKKILEQQQSQINTLTAEVDKLRDQAANYTTELRQVVAIEEHQYQVLGAIMHSTKDPETKKQIDSVLSAMPRHPYPQNRFVSAPPLQFYLNRNSIPIGHAPDNKEDERANEFLEAPFHTLISPPSSPSHSINNP